MLTKFLSLPHSFSSPFLSPPRFLFSFPKPISAAATTLDQSFSYGPSLRKGHKSPHLHPPPHRQKHEHGGEETELYYCEIDKESFTRAYDVAALRVPADRCFALESRLRGHLLNWPRVRNISRVPGKDPKKKKNLILLYVFLHCSGGAGF